MFRSRPAVEHREQADRGSHGAQHDLLLEFHIGGEALGRSGSRAEEFLDLGHKGAMGGDRR